MALKKFANFHRALTVSTHRDSKLLLLVLPVSAARWRDRIKVGVAHHTGKARRAVAGEHDVVGFFHHLSCDENRILHALQSGNRTDLRVRRHHHAGIEFHKAVKIQHRTGAGVEDRIVLENNRRGCGGVKRAAASLKNFATCCDRRRGAAYRVFIRDSAI